MGGCLQPSTVPPAHAAGLGPRGGRDESAVGVGGSSGKHAGVEVPAWCVTGPPPSLGQGDAGTPCTGPAAGRGTDPLTHLQSALALGFVSCPPHLGEGMWHGEGVWGCGGRKISHKIKFYSKITK